jgi:hypothetical protein
MKRAFPIAIAALVLIAPMPARVLADLKGGPNFSLNGLQLSANWAGYLAASNLNAPSATVTSVHGCWVTPTLTSPPSTADSIAFVGIGGATQGDSTLIQAGTRQQINHGVATYSTWYEMLPDPIATTNLSVSAGDQVCVTIQETSSDTWTINISNQTTGFSFNQSFSYASSKLTAEWIVERLSSCMVGPGGVRCRFVNLANFGSVTFTGANATIDGVNADIYNSLSYDNITMLNGLKALAQVTDPVDAVNTGEFTVTYKP